MKRKKCIFCRKPLNRKQKKWCSKKCRHRFEYCNNPKYREKQRQKSTIRFKIKTKKRREETNFQRSLTPEQLLDYLGFYKIKEDKNVKKK